MTSRQSILDAKNWLFHLAHDDHKYAASTVDSRTQHRRQLMLRRPVVRWVGEFGSAKFMTRLTMELNECRFPRRRA